MIGIGLPELIILFILAAPVVIVIIVLSNARKQKDSQIKSIDIQPPPLPKLSENDLIKEALAAFKNDNFQSAIDSLNRAIEINKQSYTAFYNRGVVLLKMGQKEKAISDFKIAANLGHEKSKEYLQNLGISY
ncbi:hypothetical protein JY97_12235 [Alkalispirochaeta odontotermitis]|nr:hypothetical protein JY97_12235 [Alkalispirochaeta odontotermitis]CAB1076022.1 hypothetical protein D1AOALGA4SA_3824 [Olavius algarvensis Delta 1 endosymbiont]